MKNLVDIEITNSHLHERVAWVDTSAMTFKPLFGGVAFGTITIEFVDGDKLTVWGEHGASDYEEKYGFKIVPL